MQKTYYLNLSDLVDSLFLILTKNNSNINEVSLIQVEKFKEILKKEATKNNINLVCVLSRSDTISFFNNNRFLYDSGIDNNSIILKEGVTPFHLIWKTAYFPIEITELLSNENIINKTFNMMTIKKEEKEFKSIKYYISSLEKMINESASKMDYEKCIELRDKLYELQYYDRQNTEIVKKNSLNNKIINE